MIAGVLELSWRDIRELRVTDPYSVHRVIYSLFPDERTPEQKNAHQPAGFLYADKGGDKVSRRILFLSNREPLAPLHGTVRTRCIPDTFLQHEVYAFAVVVNPTKRGTNGNLVPIKQREDIRKWFESRAASWGFQCLQTEVLNVDVQQFRKGEHRVTLEQALLKGVLKVTQRELFIKSFATGLGRGKAFGCGLLQIVPIRVSSN